MGCDCGQQVADRVEPIHRELVRLLASIVQPHERYVRRFGTGDAQTADASGNATGVLGPPPAGHAWYVERISKHTSAGTAVLSVCVGSRDATGARFRRDYSAASAEDISDQRQPIYVGPGEHLLLVWTGATVGATLTAGLQIRVCQANVPALVPAG